MGYERHGYTHHSLYRVWWSIKQRCYNPNDKDYEYYGERGIQVCNEWKDSAKIFVEWCLNNGWSLGLEIDRQDNDDDYCPENCRFIMHKENVINTRLLRKDNVSGYRGVSYNKKNKNWRSRIAIDKKEKFLGSFNSPEEAAIAFDEAVPDNRPRNFK